MQLFNGEQPPTGNLGTTIPITPASARRIIFWGSIALGLILLFVFLNQARGVYTDWLWFGSLEVRSVFSKILGLRIWLFFVGAAAFLALLLPNLYVAYRFSRGPSLLPVVDDVKRLVRLGVVAGVIIAVIVMAIIFGAVVTSRWETFLIFFNRVSFGIEDAQFNKDISFYVAVLPLLHYIQGWLMGAVITIAAAITGFYFLMFTARGMRFTLTPRIRNHLAVLGAFLMVTIAAAHYLDTFEPLFSGGGAAFGASYADVHARILALRIITGIALLSSVGFLVSIYFGGLRFMAASFGLWALFAVVVGAIYPTMVQRFTVDPDEFNKEATYIQRNLEATRAAYGLDNVDEHLFPYRPTLTQQDLDENPQTIDNIRLWDPIPLTATYNQIQFFQLYYNFPGVDIDRYVIDGEYKQVMLAARELSPEDLPVEAQRWVNRKLQYTHGYGAAMSPATEFTIGGEPEFFLQDIPPVGKVELSTPQIYYGENTTDFVIVKTKTDEFDFPGPEGAVYNADPYAGAGGVSVGSFIRKVAYAWQFLDVNILISNQLTSESRIMYHRTIQDRVQRIAPFLQLDKDPYLVLADGKMWWIQDAYTTTDRYPYSTPTEEGFNYIRNSVKVIIDAYNGTLKFYVVAPEDPLVRIYQKAFPDLFEPVTQPDPFQAIPEVLRTHVRYPLDLFSIQAQRYLQYHMRDPQVFYNKEDQWDFGNELFFNEPQPVKPYYVIMKLPGEQREEFALIMPFTPFEKKNMVAWMAARNDPPHYGELQTFFFPSGKQVFGPEQVEARVTFDDTIRERLTLLCPEETVVCIRGNLLVIPLQSSDEAKLGGTVLYVEPLFIRPLDLDFPPLKQVFVADGNSVVMAGSLKSGLDSLVGLGQVGITPPDLPPDTEPDLPEPTPPVVAETPEPTPLTELSSETRQQLQQIISEIRKLRESLSELENALEDVTQPTGGNVQ